MNLLWSDCKSVVATGCGGLKPKVPGGADGGGVGEQGVTGEGVTVCDPMEGVPLKDGGPPKSVSARYWRWASKPKESMEERTLDSSSCMSGTGEEAWGDDTSVPGGGGVQEEKIPLN